MSFNIFWACLMAIMCIIDICILCLEWNVLSFVGLILCSISLILTLFNIFKEY